MEIGDLFPDLQETPAWQRPPLDSPNPMVRTYGPGPEATYKCGWCRFLIAKRYRKTIYKCAFRQNTNGAATDHRYNWPACSKYQDKERY